MKKIYSHANKSINVCVFTNEESLFTSEDKCICSCINVHVFTSEESFFTSEEKVYVNV